LEVVLNYLHYEFNLSTADVVEVTLDKQANVRLMDTNNYNNYRNGKQHRYIGGLVKSSPIRLSPSSSGHWHVVVDLGGYAGTVNASVRVVR